MKTARLALCVLLIGASSPVLAISTPVTYTFLNSNQTWNSQGATNGTAAYDGGYTGYGPGGTNYGNTRTFGSGNSSVFVQAWASTGTAAASGSGYDRAIQSAFSAQFNNGANGSSQFNELAVLSANTTNASGANNVEFTSCAPGASSCTDNTGQNGGLPEHAMDNSGAYEALEFTFKSAVTLTGLSIGFPSSGATTSSGATIGSDATVLAYTGCAGCSPTTGLTSGSARTFAQLVAAGGGWTIVGNLANLAATGSGSLASSISSQYWMVGAYMDIGSNVTNGYNANYSVGNDAFKLTGITVTPVPEPDSIALFAIAGVALAGSRMRRKRVG